MFSSRNDNTSYFNTNSFNTTNSYNVHNVSNHYVVDQRSKILDWLSPLEPHIRHQDIRNSRVADVGDWLLQTDEFRSWCDGGEEESNNATPPCYGSPGAGKTYSISGSKYQTRFDEKITLSLASRNICSLVVDTLCDQAGQNTAIACFYFDYTS